MTKCDFCPWSTPKGECYWRIQNDRAYWCGLAIDDMVRTLKGNRW